MAKRHFVFFLAPRAGAGTTHVVHQRAAAGPRMEVKGLRIYHRSSRGGFILSVVVFFLLLICVIEWYTQTYYKKNQIKILRTLGKLRKNDTEIIFKTLYDVKM